MTSPPPVSTDKSQPVQTPVEMPQVPGSLGPSEAVRQVLGSLWGKKEPRTMKEITQVLETNAVYFSRGTLSGVLANMTKKGNLRRPLKKEEQWAYVLSS